jgi:Putative Flp pilus-assembly TadE/G-like/von Willebrand factor type A domain
MPSSAIKRAARIVRDAGRHIGEDERGIAIVLMTAGMLAMLGIVGLTLDGGRYYETRRQLQNAVDAAAHAGAQELPDTVAAEAAAQQYWDLNKPSVADDSTISVTFPDKDSGWADARIQIDVDATVNFSILGLLGKPSGTVGAFAEAGAQVKDIVVVLDRSGSMCTISHSSYQCRESDRRPPPDGTVIPAFSWEPLRSTQEAAVNFSMFFTPVYDEFGLVSYHTTATLEQPLTTNFNNAGDTTFSDDTINGCVNCSLFADQVLELQPGSSTNIGHGIYVAANELLYGSGRPTAAKIMVLLTDGIANRCYASGSNCGTTTAETYADNQALAAANNGITIYTIGLGPDVNDSLLQSIADVGGGIYLNAPTADDLQDTFDAIADSIRIRILQ